MTPECVSISKPAAVLVACLLTGILFMTYCNNLALPLKASTMAENKSLCRVVAVPTNITDSPEVDKPYLVEYNNEVYAFPKDLRPILPWQRIGEINTSVPHLAENTYFQYVDTVQVECQLRSRVGVFHDGGWDICLAGPYMPKFNDCLVYSFGINNQWSFDEDVSERFGCFVNAFDPTMGVKRDEYYKPRIHFFPVGLYGSNTNITIGEKTVPVQTLSTLINLAGDTGKVIDYLKFDIEGSEWDALPEMVASGVLEKYVKQIGLETHTSRSDEEHKFHIEVLEGLQRAGFRRWHTHLNRYIMFKSKSYDEFLSFGQEVYYININFLKH